MHTFHRIALKHSPFDGKHDSDDASRKTSAEVPPQRPSYCHFEQKR